MLSQRLFSSSERLAAAQLSAVTDTGAESGDEEEDDWLDMEELNEEMEGMIS